MVILIPISHSELTFSRLPFATIGLILVNVAVFILTWGSIDDGLEREQELRSGVVHYYVEHDYLEVPEDLLIQFPKVDQSLYVEKGEWIEWFLDNQEEATREIKDILESDGRQFLATEAERADQSLRTLEGKRASVRKDSLEKIRRSFLVRIGDLDFEEWRNQQNHLDELDSKYREVAAGTIARRFGFVPSDPSLLGLVGHMFLHDGIMHLIMNILFLWLVASRLEDLWGKATLIVSFLVLGLAAAAVHGAANWGSPMPAIGASGAVAGLMGAFLVRLSRTKIKFAYFYWLLFRIKFGIFEAPASLMLPLWLVSEIGNAVMFGDSSPVAYWAHIGGFAAGILLAVTFKLTDFERRVLKREPYIQTDTAELALVAFQGTGNATPPLITSAPQSPDRTRQPAGPALFVREWSVSDLDGSGLTCQSTGDELMILDPDAVTAILTGRVDTIGGHLAKEWFSSGQPPSPPAILVAFIHGTHGSHRACLIDAGKLRYNQFMPPHALKQTPRENFFVFLSLIRRTFPGAHMVNLDEVLETTNLPVHADLEKFLSSLRKAANS